MTALLMALTYALVVGGLLALCYLSTPAARRARIRREHARRMRDLGVTLPATDGKYAAHVGH